MEEKRRILSGLTDRWKDQLALYARLPAAGMRPDMKEMRKSQREREEREYDEIHQMSLGIALPADPGALLDTLSPFSLKP